MRRFAIATMGLILGIAAAGDSLAAPAFTFLEEWQPSNSGPATHALEDPSAIPLTGTTQLTADPSQISSDTLQATRTFTLAGSPTGWDVAVSGSFSGIATGLDGGSLVIATMPTELNVPSDTALYEGGLNQSGTGSAHLLDGSYLVRGSIDFFVNNNQPNPHGPLTLPFGFQFGLTANPTAVPEPASFALLAAGVGGSLAYRRRVGRRRS